MPITVNNVDNVPVESATKSKINWTQFAGIGATLLTLATSGKLNLTPDQVIAIIAAIQTLQGVASVIFKTFFNTSVTPSSAAKIDKTNTA